MKNTCRLALLALAGLLGACASQGPTAPDLPAAASVRTEVLDGWTGQAVVATVAPSGDTISVEAAGYLPRVQNAAPRVWLWPQEEAYVRALVYTPYSPGQLLARWRRPFSLRSGPPLDRGEAEAAAAILADATDWPITAAPDGEIEVVVNPGASLFERNGAAVAFAERSFEGSTLVGCRLVFRGRIERGWYRHELGHCVGLGHSETSGDLMQPGGGDHEDFSPRERVALRMMYAHRAPGNAPPDREAGMAASAMVPTRIVVVD